MSSPVVIAQAQVKLTDPHDCTDSADALAILESAFDALVRRGPDGTYQPAIAQCWTTSKDARTWTFQLRDGLTFHDGTPLDAHAMRYSIERMMRPDIGATLGAPAVWGQYLGGATLATPDKRTIAITTAEPCAYLLDILVSAYALPPHLADLSSFLSNPIGSGAYRIDNIQQGERIRMTANRNWWGQDIQNNRLEWCQLTEPADRAQALIAGSANVATRLAPRDAASLSADDQFSCVEHIDPTAIIYLLNATEAPFDDVRIRQAINFGVDREALIRTVLGGAGRALNGIVSTSHIGAMPSTSRDSYNPDLARRLLTQAGYAAGLHINVDCPTSLPDEAQALTTAVAVQLRRIGIHMTVNVISDRTQYAERVRDKAIQQLCLFDSSPLSTYRVLHEKIDSRVRGAWWQGYCNREVEALIEQIRVEVDDDSRGALLGRACAILHADPPWLSLYNHVRCMAIARHVPTWAARSDGILDVTTLPSLS